MFKRIFFGVVISSIFSLAFFLLAVPDLREKLIEKEEFFTLSSRIFSKYINFPQISDFVLKIKYDYRNTDGEVAILNGNKLELRVSNRAKDIITRYYFIPYEILREKNNFLKIEFFPQAPPNLDLRIRNYLGASEDKGLVLCLKHSLILKRDWFSLIFLSLIFFFFSFFLWQITLKIFTKYFNLEISHALLNNLIIFLPLSLFYFLVGLVSKFNPFRIAVSPAYLFIFLFFAVFLGETFLNSLSLLIERKREEGVKKEISWDNLPPWLKRSFLWIKNREFSDKCILFFMLLLILCAFFLIFKMEYIAEHLANLAYFALVLGVGIKFVKFVKEERKKQQFDKQG